MKILFFIESLTLGGKERRLVELINKLSHIQNNIYKLIIIDRDLYYLNKLPKNIEVSVLERKFSKKDLTIFFKFFYHCLKFKPNIIHVWGNMSGFYAIPAAIFLKIPIINSQIADSLGLNKKRLFSFLSHKINFLTANIIISNSKSGLKNYKIDSKKSKVIYNGVSLERFKIKKSPRLIKKEFKLSTEYLVIMVGAFSKYKNFDLFINVAKEYQFLRKDITFIAVGSGENFLHIKNRLISENINNVLLTGPMINIEELVSICDIGLLLSPFGEGMSNSIIEYMALGKPVIADNKGGNSELIINGINGYLIEEETVNEVVKYINCLLYDKKLRKTIGNNNKKLIMENFSVEKMLSEFVNIYNNFAN